jgi:hypothetical protein
MIEIFMRNKDAAAMLGVTPQRVLQLCKSGKVRSLEIAGHYFPLRLSVEEYKGDEVRKKYVPKTKKAIDK